MEITTITLNNTIGQLGSVIKLIATPAMPATTTVSSSMIASCNRAKEPTHDFQNNFSNNLGKFFFHRAIPSLGRYQDWYKKYTFILYNFYKIITSALLFV